MKMRVCVCVCVCTDILCMHAWFACRLIASKYEMRLDEIISIMGYTFTYVHLNPRTETRR